MDRDALVRWLESVPDKNLIVVSPTEAGGWSEWGRVINSGTLFDPNVIYLFTETWEADMYSKKTEEDYTVQTLLDSLKGLSNAKVITVDNANGRGGAVISGAVHGWFVPGSYEAWNMNHTPDNEFHFDRFAVPCVVLETSSPQA